MSTTVYPSRRQFVKLGCGHRPALGPVEGGARWDFLGKAAGATGCLDKANGGGAHCARMRRAFGIALACTIGLLQPARSVAQAVSATEITRETIQAASGAQAHTQVEPDIAVDPNNPQIVVAVVQQGRFPDGGATEIGYATSHDGGQTWTADDLPLLTVATGGAFERGTDPAVAFGPNGEVYAESLVFGGIRSSIAVQRSDDGGLTFGAPVLAHDDSD